MHKAKLRGYLPLAQIQEGGTAFLPRLKAWVSSLRFYETKMKNRKYRRAWTKSYIRKDGTSVNGYWRKIYYQ